MHTNTCASTNSSGTNTTTGMHTNTCASTNASGTNTTTGMHTNTCASTNGSGTNTTTGMHANTCTSANFTSTIYNPHWFNTYWHCPSTSYGFANHHHLSDRRYPSGGWV